MHRTSRLLAIVMGLACLVSISVAPAWAQEKNLTGDQIQSAIDKGRACVLKLQAADGSWEPADSEFDKNKNPTHTWGGFTALATYALLSSGSTPQDPPIVKAVAWLEKCQMKCVYCIGIRMQVWLLMYQMADPGDRNARSHFEGLAAKDAAFLLKAMPENGPLAGLWTYFGKPDRIDHSVSQYGVLGLWAAAQMGGEIPLKTWKVLDKAWRDGQYPDGGWSYGSSPSNGGEHVEWRSVHAAMTAAGVASLFITEQYSNPNGGLECEGSVTDDAIANGLEWMTKNFDSANDMYTYYGIERIGVASGYKYFGKVDWFQEIARRLIGSQGGDGSWAYGMEGQPVGTSFGLLFLARGGAPVMMNKLDYSVFENGRKVHEANWNERSRDAFNLARWTGIEAEADNLNWQVVNLEVPVEQLHDAPILYMSGNQVLKMSEADVAKLRQFIVEGGMILGNADCSSVAFKNSFIKLGEKMFPKYEFGELGRGNLIYTGETYKKMRGYQPIFGLNNGVRQLMLLFATGDPARYWQQNGTLTHTEAFQIGSDVFQYAADAIGSKALRKKGDSYLVFPDTTSPRKTIKVARLMIGNNPDPEPGGWPRLSAILHNAPYSLGVTVTPVKSGDVLAGNYDIVDLTGTTSFKIKPDEQQILKDFVAKGGTIIIDAAGGAGEFADAAEAALNQMYPKEAGEGLARALPLTSPVYNLPNAAITTVKYRRFALKNMVASTKAPHVRGIEIGKRLAIFFSREDLSAGLVGEEVDGINGYSPQTATDIMRNLVLYAAK